MRFNQKKCEWVIDRVVAGERKKNKDKCFFGDGLVTVRHEDGSVFMFNCARAFRHLHNGRCYLLVASEHNGTHYFCVEDLVDYSLSRQKGVPEVDGEGVVK